MKLFLIELKKLLITGRGILILLAFAVLWILYSIPDRLNEHSYDYETYKSIITRYEGEYTEEKKRAILERSEEINTILEEYAEKCHAYELGEYTLEEFQEIDSQYLVAGMQKSTYDYLVGKCEYYDSYESEGKYFFFETDAEDFLNSLNYNYLIMIAVLACITSVFSKEYQDRTDDMILTCKKGGIHTYICKAAAVFGVTAVFSAMIYAASAVIYLIKFGSAAIHYGVHNIIAYNIYGNISIGRYFLQNGLLTVMTWGVFAVFVCMLFAVFKKPVITVFLAFAAGVLPALMENGLSEGTSYLLCARYLTGFYHVGLSSVKLLAVLPVKLILYSFIGLKCWKKHSIIDF